MARRALLCCVLLVAGLAVVATPVAARPPPQPVSGFDGFGSDAYAPVDYPSTDTANVTVDVAVHANGTSTWTESATLTDPDAVDAFRENASLRDAVVTARFDHRFDRDTTRLRSRVANDTLVVTYRLDGVVHEAGGGVLLAPFADYRNDYYPGDADVTIEAPAGARVTSHPDAMVAADGDTTLRWNASTGVGDAGVSPGLVTFAPADAAFPSVHAALAVLATYGLPTLGVGGVYALLVGVPFGLLLSGVPRLAGRPGRDVRASALAVVLCVGVGAAVAHYPATGRVVAGTLGPFFLTLAAAVGLAVSLVGVGVHVVARRVR
ncbi:hypothetical protein EFA46_007760 [Halarchaeum sp. CBA1220]|uniref:hypothetical protein n=1 Tax=Halarchaeum sp. CBA1220 TaxID=1853682 RepID=UPI000F3A9346|nr:hypothetical protein [Halarchaeum sp. CBA1220]QLC34101.1 hypothetical protein EFA46_007760 [Halarchaeum sp. CBA1220]